MVVSNVVPAGAAQVPSPRQKVVDEAEVPEFRFVTGRFPLTSELSETVAEPVIAEVPLPRSRPVRVVAPVPPLPTARVPDTSLAGTEALAVNADVPLPFR